MKKLISSVKWEKTPAAVCKQNFLIQSIEENHSLRSETILQIDLVGIFFKFSFNKFSFNPDYYYFSCEYFIKQLFLLFIYAMLNGHNQLSMSTMEHRNS